MSIEIPFVVNWQSLTLYIDTIYWHFIVNQLTFNWSSIGIQLIYHSKSIGIWLKIINNNLTFNWHSIGILLAVNWHSNCNQLTFNWHSIDIPLEVNWHWIGRFMILNFSCYWEEFNWQCIGWFRVLPTPRIWPKSRPLIGRELRILASYWSTGLFKNIQRGYPYNLEPLPIDGF